MTAEVALRLDLSELVAQEHDAEPEDVDVLGASVLGGGEEVALRAVVTEEDGGQA